MNVPKTALFLAATLLAAPLAAEAQHVVASRQVGVLRPNAPTDPGDWANLSALLGGLGEAGYAPGQNVRALN